jgi:hypothetical protein
MQIVAQAATPIRGTTPRNSPRGPEVRTIWRIVDNIVGDTGRDGSAFTDCISTRTTYAVMSDESIFGQAPFLPRMADSNS